MMHFERILAHLSCRDLTVSGAWYARLFGRPHDATPMEGLREWHHGPSAGLQVFLDPEAAGHGSLTLIVSDLDADREALLKHGLDPGEIEEADTVKLLRLRDPDGNLVVLAEARTT